MALFITPLLHFWSRESSPRRRDAMASVVGSPAKGCVGLSPAICSMFGVTSCDSHCEPSVVVTDDWNFESSEGPIDDDRFCAAVVPSTHDGSVEPAERPLSLALLLSIEARRDWTSFVERTDGVYCTLPSESACSHCCMYWPLAICWLLISPLIHRIRSSVDCDAVSSTASHSLMLPCTFSPVRGSLKSVITPQAEGSCGSGMMLTTL